MSSSNPLLSRPFHYFLESPRPPAPSATPPSFSPSCVHMGLCSGNLLPPSSVSVLLLSSFLMSFAYPQTGNVQILLGTHRHQQSPALSLTCPPVVGHVHDRNLTNGPRCILLHSRSTVTLYLNKLRSKQEGDGKEMVPHNDQLLVLAHVAIHVNLYPRFPRTRLRPAQRRGAPC